MTQSHSTSRSTSYSTSSNKRPQQIPANYRDLLQEATVQIRKLRNQVDDLEQRQS